MRPTTTAVMFAVLAGLPVLGAPSESDLLSSKKFGDLAERVKEYYGLEQHKNWQQTWGFRVPLYQKSVPQETYVREMERATQGWRLISYRIRKVEQDGPCVLISIQFHEKAPTGYYSAQGVPGAPEITTTDYSRWEQIDGVWHAWETGSRNHIPLNSAVVAPNQSRQGRPSTCAGRNTNVPK